MKGDKGDFNKWEEIFYRTTLKTNFNEDVEGWRKSLGIPIDGFFSEEKRLKWLTKEKALDLFASEMDLLKKYSLPIVCRSLLSNYLFFNGEIKAHQIQKPVVAAIDRYPQNDEFYKEFGQPFVKLYIFDDSNIKQIQKFIKDNWETVKEMFLEQRQFDVPEIKKKRNTKRDKEIFTMYNKSREELGLRKGQTKDIEVANLLRVKYPRISSELVRKVVSEQKKLRE